MSTLNPNWNIVGDNPIKRTFKIPVGNLSQEETEKLIKKMMGYDWEEEIRKQILIDRKLKINKIINGI